MCTAWILISITHIRTIIILVKGDAKTIFRQISFHAKKPQIICGKSPISTRFVEFGLTHSSVWIICIQIYALLASAPQKSIIKIIVIIEASKRAEQQHEKNCYKVIHKHVLIIIWINSHSVFIFSRSPLIFSYWKLVLCVSSQSIYALSAQYWNRDERQLNALFKVW